MVDWVPGRHGRGEVLPKEGVAVSIPSPGVKMRNQGPVQEDVQCLDVGKYTLGFTWKCLAAWCGSAVPESLPALNPLGKPRLGSSRNGWMLVSRRASSGKQRGHIAGGVGVSVREGKTGSRISYSWQEKCSWIRGETLQHLWKGEDWGVTWSMLHQDVKL